MFKRLAQSGNKFGIFFVFIWSLLINWENSICKNMTDVERVDGWVRLIRKGF